MLSEYDTSTIPAETFVLMLQGHRLGQGEAECLAICFHNSALAIATDDKKARRVARDAFGVGRLEGSGSILKHAVDAGILTAEAAMIRYDRMIQCGAFLPKLTLEYFTK